MVFTAEEKNCITAGCWKGT